MFYSFLSITLECLSFRSRKMFYICFYFVFYFDWNYFSAVDVLILNQWHASTLILTHQTEIYNKMKILAISTFILLALLMVNSVFYMLINRIRLILFVMIMITTTWCTCYVYEILFPNLYWNNIFYGIQTVRSKHACAINPMKDKLIILLSVLIIPINNRVNQ